MEDSLGLILQGIQNINNRLDKIEENMATKDDINNLNKKLKSFHAENINADNKLMEAVNEIRNSVRFVNRKVADTELELDNIKNMKQ
ncbi:hypothetical protein [Bacillus stercoris]|uniref:hypothetical protein n=1 Tax=Bacillus stercoris TaxID=2054641 RepID=UPI003CFA64D3